MDVDEDRIDEAVLALLWLTLHDGARGWKGHDWDALDRLHRKGLPDRTAETLADWLRRKPGNALSPRLAPE